MSVPAGDAADAPAVLPAGVLSIVNNGSNGVTIVRVRVQTIVLERMFEHVIDIKFRYRDFPSVHLIEGPFHPHISGDRYCCDYGIRSQVIALAQEGKFMEAALVVMNGLTFINPRSAYSMYDARRCCVCEEYTFSAVTCGSCNRAYCPRHASACSWCGEVGTTCRRCSSSVCANCSRYRAIIELPVTRQVKRIFITNEILSVSDFIKENRLTLLKGIGPKTEVKVLSALMASEQLGISIYWYLCQFLELDSRNYLSDIPRDQRLKSREIISRLHLNHLLSQNAT